MVKIFRLLREKLPLEIQARAKARPNEMLEEIALRELSTTNRGGQLKLVANFPDREVVII